MKAVTKDRGQAVAFTWSRDTVADQQMVVPLDKDVATDVTSIIGCVAFVLKRSSVDA